jgi:hypothetical protein
VSYGPLLNVLGNVLLCFFAEGEVRDDLGAWHGLQLTKKPENRRQRRLWWVCGTNADDPNCSEQQGLHHAAEDGLEWQRLGQKRERCETMPESMSIAWFTTVRPQAHCPDGASCAANQKPQL